VTWGLNDRPPGSKAAGRKGKKNQIDEPARIGNVHCLHGGSRGKEGRRTQEYQKKNSPGVDKTLQGVRDQNGEGWGSPLHQTHIHAMLGPLSLKEGSPRKEKGQVKKKERGIQGKGVGAQGVNEIHPLKSEKTTK